MPYMKIYGNTPLMRPILYDSDSLRIKDGLYYLNFVTDFIEIYRERILVSDCFCRSFEESVPFANPNDDGYFEFGQNCTTWQAMDGLTKT